MNEDTTGTVAAEATPRPRERTRVHAVLSETRAGWSLVLHVGENATYLTDEPNWECWAFAQVTVEIVPNLVPGQPFPISRIRVVTTDSL